MSFDIFLQDFSDRPTDRRQEVLGMLRPLLDGDQQNVITTDGSLAVHGLDSSPLAGLMLNQVEGDGAWQVIFEIAVAADWVVMPVGSKVSIVNEAQRLTVPEEAAAEGIVLVRSGAELRQAAIG